MLSVVGSVVAIGLLSSYGSFPFVVSGCVIFLLASASFIFGPAPFWFAYKLGYFVLLVYVFVIQGLGLGNSGAFLFINTMKFESNSEKVVFIMFFWICLLEY